MLLRPTNRANTAPPTLQTVVYSSYVCKVLTASLLGALLLSPVATVYGNEGNTASSSSATIDLSEEVNDEESVADTTADDKKVSESETDADTEKEATDTTNSDDTSETDTATSSDEDVDSTEATTDVDQASSSIADVPDTGASSSTTTPNVAASSTDTAAPTVAGTSTIATSSSDVEDVVATSSDNASSTQTDTDTTNASTTEDLVASSSNSTLDTGVVSTTATSSSETEPATQEDLDSSNGESETTAPETKDEAKSTAESEPVGTTSPNEVASSSEAEAAGTGKESQLQYVNDGNRYQFSEQECVEVENGTYYCQTTDSADHSAAATQPIVESRLDTNGYPNIYLNAENTTLQITDNQYEDEAPHYDPVSDSVVWQQKRDGVYQIAAYDIDTEETSLLTDSAQNNMQAVRSGEVTVWQRWLNGAWQVMLHEGTTVQQISFNTHHNIAPYVRGEYVIWNVVSGHDNKKVAVYEIATGNLEYIDDPEGGQVTNPRFVLMYDTTFANGDVVTKGFDPETGNLVPLGAEPAAPTPNIPSSDPVGETRALLNTKSNNEEEDDMPTVTRDTATSSNATSSSSETVHTLNLSSGTSTASSSAELSEFDLPIAPHSTTTPTSTDTNSHSSSSASSTQSNNS